MLYKGLFWGRCGGTRGGMGCYIRLMPIIKYTQLYEYFYFANIARNRIPITEVGTLFRACEREKQKTNIRCFQELTDNNSLGFFLTIGQQCVPSLSLQSRILQVQDNRRLTSRTVLLWQANRPTIRRRERLKSVEKSLPLSWLNICDAIRFHVPLIRQ